MSMPWLRSSSAALHAGERRTCAASAVFMDTAAIGHQPGCGLPLRHVLEPRHASFACADYVRLARDYRVATVCTDSPGYPHIADLTADFVYARLMRAQADEPAGYAPGQLDAWARRVTTWARGEAPADLPLIDGAPPPAAARDVFVYFIGAAKARNPAAALGLIKRLPPR